MAVATSLFGTINVLAGDITLKIAATSDVHGNFFPYNFVTRSGGSGSLARVATRINKLRDSLGVENVVLLDNGDILQGQPTAYFYNFINTNVKHPVASMLEYLGYDAQTIGNHDIETGHAVYDRYRQDLKLPLLGANVIDKSTGQPYFKPYTVIEKRGLRIAILGLITPAIPAWLPETLWSGIEFKDMVESAREWVPYILDNEKPDLVVGLFHSGHDAEKKTGEWLENASLLVAEQVPGFDLVFMGHDHTPFCETIINVAAAPVVVMNPGSNATFLAECDVVFSLDDGIPKEKKVSGMLTPLNNLKPDSAFTTVFRPVQNEVLGFVKKKIGVSTGDFSVKEAYFGPSAFMQLLHELQLEISGADISLAAPLSFDAVISRGDLHMSDMFTLYKYENMLYTIAMSGREIKDYLEMSYALWTDVMKSEDDNLLLFAEHDNAAKGDFSKLLNPTYNFDSAAGIVYTVDVTKPQGEKIDIISLSDGTPFGMDKTYKVAVNSYRGNGGGDLLTKGAGISHDELKSRVLKATDKDLRFYLIKEIERRERISPDIVNNWKFIPEEMARKAAKRDRVRLFGPQNL